MKNALLGRNLLDVNNTIPHAGCSDVDPNVDRCSYHAFGLLKCGCSCVRPQGEEFSKYVGGNVRLFFLLTNLKHYYKLKIFIRHQVDFMYCGIISSQVSMRILYAVMCVAESLSLCKVQ